MNLCFNLTQLEVFTAAILVMTPITQNGRSIPHEASAIALYSFRK